MDGTPNRRNKDAFSTFSSNSVPWVLRLGNKKQNLDRVNSNNYFYESQIDC